MNIIRTKAIVLSSIKYGENSLIVKCFTQEKGTQSYILKGVLKPKKWGAAYFQPLNQLEIVATCSEHQPLHYIKEARIAYHYQQIPLNMLKNTVMFFLSEITSELLSNAMEEPTLFSFVEHYLQWYDISQQHANFHLKYLIDFTHFLGFAPNVLQIHLPFFDVEEGLFVASPEVGYTLSLQETATFKRLLTTPLTDIGHIRLNKHERNALLESILQYYCWHLPDFKTPKSWSVLREISDIY